MHLTITMGGPGTAQANRIMDAVSCTREDAIKALTAHRGDVDRACIYLVGRTEVRERLPFILHFVQCTCRARLV
jgi:hypothetical protein